jgi:hypothetical protein
VLVWINGYVCRNWLFHPTAHMETLDGVWTAVARLGEGWWSPSWWPYWGCGMPFEFTSTPLIPAMTALAAGLGNLPHQMAYQWVAAFFYCAAPLVLFAFACSVTGTAGFSFLAALFFSLLSPAQALAPEQSFLPAGFFEPHRFHLQVFRDATPICAALVFVLLFVLFLDRRRHVPAALALALAMLATPFAVVLAAIGAGSPAAVKGKGGRAALAAGLLALALAARWLTPSVWSAAIGSAAAYVWSFGTLTAVSAAAAGWMALTGRRVHVFTLLAWGFGAIPLCAAWLVRSPVPYAAAFRIPMDAAFALAAVFAARPWIERLPRSGQGALALAGLALAAEQIVTHRRLAKDALFPVDVKKTVEYRTAGRLPPGRAMLPAGIANWANAFTDVEQVSGAGFRYNPAIEMALESVYHSARTPLEARGTLAWAKSYGAATVVLPRVELFDGMLPRLWDEKGAAAYGGGLPATSLAWVVPENALVRRRPARALDSAEVERFTAPTACAALFEWRGRNAAQVRADVTAGEVVSIRVSHHPGWHAFIEGKRVPLRRDGLGLMWLRAERSGPATIVLQYDGGWELRLCRWLSVTAGALALWIAARGTRS